MEVGLKKKDLHKIIRDSGAQDNTLLVQALKAKHPELADKPKTNEKRNRKFKWLVAAFATLSAAEALALILIPTLLPSGGKPTPPNEILNGQGQSTPYKTTKINSSMQEYNEAHGTSFLFFDTVEYDYRIYEHRDINTDEFLGLQVTFICEYGDERVGYTVCAEDVAMDYLSYDIQICTNKSAVSDCAVKWGTSYGTSYGIFSYGNYDYYVYVSGSTSRLFELVQDLLPSQQ